MRFRHKLLIARDIGRLFGKTNQEVNETLEKLGYRDGTTKQPTSLAKENELCELVAVDGFINTGWNPNKLVPVLTEYGYQLQIALPDDLVEPPDLSDEFRSDGNSLLNSAGDRIAYFENNEHTVIVCKILNLAAKTGVLERLQSR